MVKRLKKPKPTLETSLILRFGLEFIGLSEEDPEDKMLFDAFIHAHGLVQKGFYFFVTHQKFRVPTGDEIQNLTDAVEPYRNDPEACAHLRETYKRLREMVYVATAESSDKPCNDACQEAYLRLRQAGKPAKVALIAIANKLLRQAMALARKGESFTENYKEISLCSLHSRISLTRIATCPVNTEFLPRYTFLA